MQVEGDVNEYGTWREAAGKPQAICCLKALATTQPVAVAPITQPRTKLQNPISACTTAPEYSLLFKDLS
ncbi:MAG: hypothetical protein IT342_10075 [Candidatus Melainabacteria bacterium]|nr:hypothetical protein [Candidatus Melainabacteria bacterium]